MFDALTTCKETTAQLPKCPMFHQFLVGVWHHHAVAAQFRACVQLLPQRYEASASLSHLATVLHQKTQNTAHMQNDKKHRRTGFPLSWLQKVPGLFQEFQAPRSIFPGPCRKPTMFKYSNKHQLRSLGERCKLCQRGPGRNLSREIIFGILVA